MSQATLSQRQEYLLAFIAYLTLVAVGAIELAILYEAGRPWWPTAGLLVAFGLVFACTPDTGTGGWKSHLYLAVQTSLVAGVLWLEGRSSFLAILYFILSPQAMMLFPRWRGLAWIGVFTLVTGGAFIYLEGWPDGLWSVPLYVTGFLFFGVVAHALTETDAARRESQSLLEQLQAAHRRLQEYATQAQDLAVTEERNRMAREMHDTLGHRLTVAAVQLEGAQRLIPSNPDRAAQMVGTVREQVREALSELRRTVAALKEPLDSDLGPSGSLSHALSRLAAGFEEVTGLTVHLSLPEGEIPVLLEAQRLAFYRAAQEALTNVQRHARAREVWLQLTCHGGALTLLVADDGVGLAPGNEQAGFGLQGLKERAVQLGGDLAVEARPGGGTQLSIQLPIGEGRG